jgi:hypothetical protein
VDVIVTESETIRPSGQGRRAEPQGPAGPVPA